MVGSGEFSSFHVLFVELTDVFELFGLEEGMHGLVTLDKGLFTLDDDIFLFAIVIHTNIDKRLPELCIVPGSTRCHSFIIIFCP